MRNRASGLCTSLTNVSACTLQLQRQTPLAPALALDQLAVAWQGQSMQRTAHADDVWPGALTRAHPHTCPQPEVEQAGTTSLRLLTHALQVHLWVRHTARKGNGALCTIINALMMPAA
jgi:hypothetical protein